MKYLSLFAIMIIASLTIISCKDDPTTAENLTAEWNSTSVKIDGVVTPAINTKFMHLQISHQFEITTTISPFTHPKSGIWSVNSAGDKLTLDGNAWTIHQLAGNTLRIGFVVDGKELEIDFAK